MNLIKVSLKPLSPFANITYSDFEYKDYKFQSYSGAAVTTVDYGGHAVAGVAKFVGNVGVT